MFPWVFWATVLTHGTSGRNPTLLAWANPTRAAEPSFPLGRGCMLTAARPSVNVSWLLKPNRGPTWHNHGIFSMRLCHSIFLIRMLWSISQHIWSCFADQHVLTAISRYVHAVAVEFLGKRWCQRVQLQLQLPLHYNYNYHYTTTTTSLQLQLPVQQQLQL